MFRTPVWATVSAIFVILLTLSVFMNTRAQSHAQRDPSGPEANEDRQRRFTPDGEVDAEIPVTANRASTAVVRVTEAPAAFDNLTNGFDIQGAPFNTINEETVVPLRSFNDNRFIFEEVEGISDGLGPTYNAQSCRECHQNVVTGGASQVTEHRTGRLQNGQFFESLGGSLIQSRATHPDMAERIAFQDDIRTFRISTNTLGNGFVEAISNTTLEGIRDAQPVGLRGTLLIVPVLEANSRGRYGRFGWKNQHASLESFSADAYLNEMGITTPTFPDENTSSGRDVRDYDSVADPEDDGVDAVAFANFMRSTKAPPRGPITAAVTSGEGHFRQAGCAACHIATIRTAPLNTSINGGKLLVRAALADKLIHPYSDFLLHDIGTGDGIPVLPTSEFASTASQIRTAPLWGLRTRNRLMHDGLSFTREDAIRRHGRQALRARTLYDALLPAQKIELLAFLDSL
jgi:CxxC motif-containing protein (DUF1111 family)